jgi:hypothetical protein
MGSYSLPIALSKFQRTANRFRFAKALHNELILTGRQALFEKIISIGKLSINNLQFLDRRKDDQYAIFPILRSTKKMNNLIIYFSSLPLISSAKDSFGNLFADKNNNDTIISDTNVFPRFAS